MFISHILHASRPPPPIAQPPAHRSVFVVRLPVRLYFPPSGLLWFVYSLPASSTYSTRQPAQTCSSLANASSAWLDGGNLFHLSDCLFHPTSSPPAVHIWLSLASAFQATDSSYRCSSSTYVTLFLQKPFLGGFHRNPILAGYTHLCLWILQKNAKNRIFLVYVYT